MEDRVTALKQSVKISRVPREIRVDISQIQTKSVAATQAYSSALFKMREI
jgi:hypothetical protein